LAPTAAPSPAAALTGIAEEVLEDVRHEVAELVAESGTATGPATVLKGRMAEAVVGTALLGIGEDLIGLVDLDELDLGLGIAGVLVRRPLHGELAEARLEFDLGHRPLDAEHLVIVAFGHQPP